MIQINYIHDDQRNLGIILVDPCEVSEIRQAPGSEDSHISLHNGHSYLIPLSADKLLKALKLKGK